MKPEVYKKLSFGEQQAIINEWRSNSEKVGEKGWVSFDEFLRKRK